MFTRSPQRNRSTNSKASKLMQCFVVGVVGLVLVNSAYSRHDRFVRVLDSATSILDYTSNAKGPSSDSDNPPATSYYHSNFPLGIPEGEAEPLPSIRIETGKEEVERGIYGGKGDKKHLGGFTQYDGQGVSPAVWEHMITNFGIKSLMDVGCGKGVSTLWFAMQGVDVLCVEGSHDAVERNLIPASQIVEHDFSRGPYWPAETYDAVWSVEFLEHVGRNFQYNYIQAFRKAALIFVSHSHWGGWHHVEVHDNDWWITKFESFGFKYSQSLTEEVKKIAVGERQNEQEKGPDGNPYNAQHVWLTMQVFINPAVASLPKHAHLFSEHGCFKSRSGAGIVHKECGTLRGGEGESKLPASFYPLQVTEEHHRKWLEIVSASITSSEASQPQ